MVVAGTEKAVLMVESEANELTEDQMLGAVLFAHQEMQVVIAAVNELKAEAGKEAWVWEPAAPNTALIESMTGQFGEQIGEAYRNADKMSRQNKLGELKDAAVAAFETEDTDADEIQIGRASCRERV